MTTIYTVCVSILHRVVNNMGEKVIIQTAQLLVNFPCNRVLSKIYNIPNSKKIKWQTLMFT